MLNILTTATPRPELHNETAIKAVQELSKEIKNIHWYINIDCPRQFFKEEDRKATADNFLSLKAPGLKTTIFSKHSSSHFGRAARRLYGSCKPEGKNDIFLWLEDDWAFQPDKNFFYLLDYFFTSNQNFLLCSKLPYVTGNPFFFRRDFFDHIVNKLYSIKEHLDPEDFLWQCVEEKYNIDCRDLPVNSVHKAYFFDMGRKWRKDRSISKINRNKSAIKTITWRMIKKK
jgi:hypothetical protein